MVSWEALFNLINPFHPKTGTKVEPPTWPLQTQLGIHLMQHCPSLIDLETKDFLTKKSRMRLFPRSERT
jgi:IS5 family transposase